MTSVLDYFKQTNPGWEKIATVVIDKDFVEWRELESAFPATTILLCQFHAISYWKKMMSRSVYSRKISHRQDLLGLMMKLLYSQTAQEYDTRYDAFEQYCVDAKLHAFFVYFEKNWHSCRSMWANFKRGTFFTAGNTTTNRIESNWNQLKMLLGHKTRIDKTIAGLLQHQMMITQQIVSTIAQQHSTSRVLKTIPKIFRAVACRLSIDVLSKVKKEWECYINQLSHIKCLRNSSSVSRWKMDCFNQSFTCDDLEWAFLYKSNHLPCRHLMHLAHEGHKLNMLPAMAVHERWDTYVTLSVKDEISVAADALRSIVQMSYIRLPKVRSPEADGPTVSTSLNPLKQVVYVRLRRHERANQVVLSSAEKYSYAKVMLKPLLDHLSGLSSPDFYRELQAWKETIDLGLSLGKGTKSDTNYEDVSQRELSGSKYDIDSKVETDLISELDPADAIDTANLMNVLEDTCLYGSTYGSTDEADEQEDGVLPPTQKTVSNHETTLQQEFVPPTDVDSVKSGVTSGSSTYYPHDVAAPVAIPPARQVDIINVPMPKSRGRTRTTTKQLRQTKISLHPDRLAVHPYPSNLTVSLDRLLVWHETLQM